MTTNTSLPRNVSVAERRADGRLHAPAAERNAQAITDLLRSVAPQSGRALEIASGTGQHVAGFADALPGLTWQPTEIDAERRKSIDSWTGGRPNVRPAKHLDATTPGWSESHPGQDLILVVNLLHLITTAQTRTVITEVSDAITPGGRFLIYGPFLRDGRATSEGDARFDASLRAADPAIGYKDVDDVRQWLADAGMTLTDSVDMPANNLTLVSKKP
ncbi:MULTISPECIES: DUF938 domain-containing protein [unclassified Roseovarius]|uniref:DUF938 domain-containing protein n=1 Tax=unclassified Roseovarius TaxID=2614913 RepID=UPI00273D5C21|nr:MULTISPECIES: DUF938 domain-containing protein [unclassified Roseovarius]